MVRSTRTDMASMHTATRRQPGSLSRLSPLLLPEKGRFCTENLCLMSLGLDSSIRRKCVWAHSVVCGASRQGRSDIWVGSNPHSFGAARANAGQSIPWDR